MSCRSSSESTTQPQIFISDFYTGYNDSLRISRVNIFFDSLSGQYVVDTIRFGDTVSFVVACCGGSAGIANLALQWDTLSMWMVLDLEHSLDKILIDSIGRQRDRLTFLPGYSAISCFIHYAPRDTGIYYFSLKLENNAMIPDSVEYVFSQTVCDSLP